LLLEKRYEGFERVACLELKGKWMFIEVCCRPDSIFLPRSLKKCLKNRRVRRGTHIAESSGRCWSPGYRYDVDEHKDGQRA
jgi:hypothetical protein